MGLSLEGKVLGALMGASWVNAAVSHSHLACTPLLTSTLQLFGVSICLYIAYYRAFKQDLAWIRAAVIFSFLVDCVGIAPLWTGSPTDLSTALARQVSTVNQCVMVYGYSVTHFGSYEYLTAQPVEFFIYLVTTGLSALIIQTYLMARIWKLSRNLILIAVLLLLALTAIAGAIATAIVIEFVYNSIEDREGVQTSVIFFFLTG